MGCATSLVKFLIFFFNFLFVAGGVALVTFGVLFINGYKTYETILPDLGPYSFPPILIIVIGCIVFFIAFMGCCGTIRESKCMMMTYATVLLILLIAEVALVVLFYTHQDQLKDAMEKGLKKSLTEYEKEEVREVWDTMQHNFECCGAQSYKDWGAAGVPVPPSCCKSKPCNNDYFTEGCVDKLFTELKTDYGMYAAAILAGVELLGILFGCCLGARFGRKMYHT